mgnify:CR=1 FL=1
MATIGTFKKTGSNEFTGEIVTLSVQAKGVRIVPDTRATGENAPSHRVLVGRAEIGAAWSKRSNEGRDYLGLKLDDPSFNAPIYANLFDDEEGEGFTAGIVWDAFKNFTTSLDYWKISIDNEIQDIDANSLLLTAVIRFNAGEPRAAKRYARLARACRFCPPAAGEQEAFQALLTAVETLKQQCAIPTLKGALQEKYPLFLSRIPAMVPAALADATLRTNPRPVDGAAIAQLLENLQ